MLTIQPVALSIVQLTALKPGDLFQYSGQQGNYLAMLVQNEAPQYASWLYLTGKHLFRMEDTGHGGSFGYAHAPKVLRLGIHRKDLSVQIDETKITRAAAGTLCVGSLVIQEQPRIVTRFGVNDADLDGTDNYGVSLADLSREPIDAPGGYVCDHWQLLALQQGLPPETIAEFSRPRPTASEPLRI